jgi:hypothetical protein
MNLWRCGTKPLYHTSGCSITVLSLQVDFWRCVESLPLISSALISPCHNHLVMIETIAGGLPETVTDASILAQRLVHKLMTSPFLLDQLKRQHLDTRGPYPIAVKAPMHETGQGTSTAPQAVEPLEGEIDTAGN